MFGGNFAQKFVCCVPFRLLSNKEVGLPPAGQKVSRLKISRFQKPGDHPNFRKNALGVKSGRTKRVPTKGVSMIRAISGNFP